MKEKIGNFTFCLFCFVSIIFIFTNNKDVAEVIINATNLFLRKVFVSLFPMFIINDILINLNIPYYFYLVFNKLFLKVFKTSGLGAYVFIMSLISGTPSNAYILKELVEERSLSYEEASHFLMFTYFSNPLFLTIMLGSIFDSKTTLKIILIHYISNILIGILKRGKAPKITHQNFQLETRKRGKAPKITHQNFQLETRKRNGILIKSINKSISTLLMILGTVTFYMLLTYIITYPFQNNILLKTCFSGLLEITNGLNNLINLNIYSKIKEIIAIAIISFGGLSIHAQIKAILEDTQIKYKYFLKGRLLHTMISILLIIII